MSIPYNIEGADVNEDGARDVGDVRSDNEDWGETGWETASVLLSETSGFYEDDILELWDVRELMLLDDDYEDQEAEDGDVTESEEVGTYSMTDEAPLFLDDLSDVRRVRMVTELEDTDLVFHWDLPLGSLDLVAVLHTMQQPVEY